jgi:hypothetical protein
MASPGRAGGDTAVVIQAPASSPPVTFASHVNLLRDGRGGGTSVDLGAVYTHSARVAFVVTALEVLLTRMTML